MCLFNFFCLKLWEIVDYKKIMKSYTKNVEWYLKKNLKWYSSQNIKKYTLYIFI